MRVGSLFSGIGGIDLGLERAGFDIAWQVEKDAYCRQVLASHWPRVQNLGDIHDVIGEILRRCEVQNNKQLHSDILNVLMQRTAQDGDRVSVKDAAQQLSWLNPSSSEGGDSVPRDAGTLLCEDQNRRTPAVEHGCVEFSFPMESRYASHVTPLFIPGGVDVITGGVPCQPASCAGKQRGSRDDRWLWPETLAVIRFFQPSWVILENVYGLVSIERGVAFESVCATLETFGYEVQPFAIPACAVDAPHIRQRIWILAHAARDLRGSSRDEGSTALNWSDPLLANAEKLRWRQGNQDARGYREGAGQKKKRPGFADGSWWAVEPSVGRVAARVPHRVDRLRALGNAVVPQVVEALGNMIYAAHLRG